MNRHVLASPAGADDLMVLSDRGDRGGVICIPIAAPIPSTDPAYFGGNPPTDFQADDALMAEIVANFPARKAKGPIPVYFGHIPDEARRTEPAAGFIDSIGLQNGKPWAVIDLGPDAFQKVVRDRGFRSFSFELDQNKSWPSGTIDGWSLSGGAITNTPALPVEFVAATLGDRDTHHSAPALRGGTMSQQAGSAGADTMTPEKAAQIRAEAATAKAESDRVAAENATLKAELAAAKAKADQVVALELRVAAAERQNVAGRVRVAIESALRDFRIAKAEVEGYEGDPAKWLDESPFRDAAALERHLAARQPITQRTTQTGSFAEQQASGDAVAALDAEVKKLSAEQKISYGDALKSVRFTRPDLYQAGMAARKFSMSQVG